MIVDCAVYDDGVRRPGRLPLRDVFEASRAEGSFVWIGLVEPTVEEFAEVRKEFGLHPLAVEDAVKAHQRAKVEVYGNTLFVVLKPVRYVDPDEIVEVGEVMLFIGQGFAVTVRHGKAVELKGLRDELESRPELLRCGPGAVLHAIVDRTVDGYEEALLGVEADVAAIENAVFQPTRNNHAERIYRLKREVLEFRQAVVPLAVPLERLGAKDTPWIVRELRPYFRDVHDHVLRATDEIEQLDNLLTNVLSAQLTQVAVAQNDDMRKISAWVAIAAVPTMLAGIYGMNFHHMPELAWSFGYYWILGVMAVACGLLYWLFRRSGWL